MVPSSSFESLFKVVYFLAHESAISPRSLLPLNRECYLESQIWVLGVLFTLGRCFLSKVNNAEVKNPCFRYTPSRQRPKKALATNS